MRLNGSYDPYDAQQEEEISKKGLKIIAEKIYRTQTPEKNKKRKLE